MILALYTVDCFGNASATTENSTHKISKHEARKISKAADTQRIDMLEYRANARNGARRFGASFEGA